MPLPATIDVDRPGSNTPTSTFAAVELNLRNKEDQTYLADAITHSRTMAVKAWKHYERLGVVRYPLHRAARIAGAATLYATVLDDENTPTGPITRTGVNAIAADIVGGIYSRFGGVRGLIERYFLHQKVPADSHLIRLKESGGYDGYMFLSPDELQTPQDAIPGTNGAPAYRWIMSPRGATGGGGVERTIARKDYLGRVWSPSARFINWPESPLYTLDADCDLFYRMMVVLRAQYRSRAIIGNALFLPASLNQLAQGEVTATGSTELVNKWAEIERRNAELSEDGDAVDVAHIIVSGADEAGEKIREITFGRETLETDLKLRAELFDRIMFALDINTRATTGESQNHFSAWSDNADELRLAVKPDVEAMCWAFTRLILRPQLMAADVDPNLVNRLAVWYDLSEASVKINRQEDSRQLVDRGGLALRSARKVGGFEETDAPTEEEYIRQFGYMAKNPFAAFWKLSATDDPDWDWDMVMPKPPGKPLQGQGDPAESDGGGDPGSPDSKDDETKSPDD
jgi:hypothetical protein